jgi:ankyrin repeat protein
MKKMKTTRLLGAVLLMLVALNVYAQENKEVQEFLSAAATNDVAKVQAMLNESMDVNARNENGETALLIGSPHPKIVKILLAAGADVNARNKFGETPLMYSVAGNTPGTKLLLEAGADVKAKDGDGITVLMWAVDEGRIEEVKMLIEAGADINARDKKNKSVLKHARDSFNLEAMEILKKAGGVE